MGPVFTLISAGGMLAIRIAENPATAAKANAAQMNANTLRIALNRDYALLQRILHRLTPRAG